MIKILNLIFNDIEQILEADEIIILQDFANLFRGGIAIGGKLTLTQERILFQPHKLNFDTDEGFIDLDNIKGIKKVKTLNIIDTSLSITTENGDDFIFVLGAENRDKWYDKLNSLV